MPQAPASGQLPQLPKSAVRDAKLAKESSQSRSGSHAQLAVSNTQTPAASGTDEAAAAASQSPNETAETTADALVTVAAEQEHAEAVKDAPDEREAHVDTQQRMNLDAPDTVPADIPATPTQPVGSLNNFSLSKKDAENLDVSKSSRELESRGRSDEEDFSDSAIFHGFEFDASNTGKHRLYSSGLAHSQGLSATMGAGMNEGGEQFMDSRPLRNPLDDLDPQTRLEEERAILAKYLKHGTLSTFRGREDMRIFKSRLMAKREIKDARDLVAIKESELLHLEDLLVETRENRQRACMDLDKIAAELEQIIESVHKSHVKIPRHKQIEHAVAMRMHHRHSTQNGTGIGTDIRSPGNSVVFKHARSASVDALHTDSHDILRTIAMRERASTKQASGSATGTSSSSIAAMIPSDPQLMLNQRYRMLREHYYEHQEYIEKASQTIPELEAALVPLRQELSELHAHLWALRPLKSDLANAELQEYTELQVVAKYRAMEAERRQRAWISHQRHLARQAARVNDDHAEKQRLISATVHAHGAQMRKWFRKTIRKSKIERDTRLKEQVNAAEKKKQAMVQLQTHIEQIKGEINAEKERRKVDALTKPSLLAPAVGQAASKALDTNQGTMLFQETPLILATKQEIERKRTERQRILMEKRARKEQRKMEILKKLIDEEDKRRSQEEAQRRRMKFERALESRAPLPNRAFPPDVMPLKIDKSDALAPAKISSRPHSHDHRHLGSRLPSPSPTRLDRIDERLRERSARERSRERESRHKKKTQSKPQDPKLLTDFMGMSFENSVSLSSKSKVAKSNDADAGGGFTAQKAMNASKQMLVSTASLAQVPERRHLPPPRMTNYKPQRLEPHLPAGASSFVVSPSEFTFKDYMADRAYIARATITNVSGRINSFKLLSVPIEISNFFDIQFAPPGKLGAGTSWDVSVVFQPPPGFNQDIPATRIGFIAEIGGEFGITVSCSTCKCRPVVACVGGDNVKLVKFYDKVDPPGSDIQPIIPVIPGLNLNPATAASLAKAGLATTLPPLAEARMASRKSRIDMDVHRLVGNFGSRRLKPVAEMSEEGVVSLDLGSCVVGAHRSLFIDLSNLGATSVGYEVLPEHIYQQRLEQNNSPAKELQTKLATAAVSDVPGTEISVTSKPNTTNTKPATEKSIYNTVSNTPASQSSEWKVSHGPFRARGRNKPLGSYDSHIVHFDFCPPYSTSPRSDAEKDPEAFARVMEGKQESAKFVILFERDDIDPIHVECRAVALEAPIFIDRDVVDFKVCILGHSYQDHLIVRNHHNIALKFWIEFCGNRIERTPNTNSVQIPGLGTMEVSPTFAFAQPFEPFYIWFTVKPMASACHLPDASGRQNFSVPMRVKYTDDTTGEDRSIPFSIAGILTSDKISLTAVNGDKKLDFGITSTLETKEVPLVITNLSVLPQMVQFAKSHAFLNIVPVEHLDGPDCVVSLAPRESIVRQVRFDPAAEAEYDVRLTCQSTWGHTFDIRCCGVGVKPLARFEHSQIVFEPCAFGNSRSARVRLLCGSQHKTGKMGSVARQAKHRDKAAAKHKGSDVKHETNHAARGFVDPDSFESYLAGSDDQITFEFGAPIVVGIDNYNYGDSEQILVDVLKLDPEPGTINPISSAIEAVPTSAPAQNWSREPSRIGSLRTGSIPAGAPALPNAASQNAASAVEAVRVSQVQANRVVPSTSSVAGSDDRKVSPESLTGFSTASTVSNRSDAISMCYPLGPSDPQIVYVWPTTGKIDAKSPASIEVSIVPPMRKQRSMSIKAGDTAKPLDVSVASAIDRTSLVAKNKTGSNSRLQNIKAGGKDKDGATGREASRGQARTTTAPGTQPAVGVAGSGAADAGTRLKMTSAGEGNTDGGDGSATTNAIMTAGQVTGAIVGYEDSTSMFARRLASMASPVITFLIPCYLKRTISEKNRLRAFIAGVAPSAEPTGSETDGETAEQTSIIYFKVVAPLFQPDLVLVDPENGKLDMNRVPVGVRGYKDIRISNVSMLPVRIRCSGLGPLGPFRIVKSSRMLNPNKTRTLRIAFEPEIDRRFSSILEISSNRSLVKVRLMGEGVHPTIEIDPSDRVLAIGDVCVGDQATKTFKLSNTSSIPITFVFSLSRVRSGDSYIGTNDFGTTNGSHNESLNGENTQEISQAESVFMSGLRYGVVNHSGINAFSVSPLRCTIAPGSSQDITVRFSPDRESDLFFDHISIKFWGQPEPVYVRVHGRAWTATTAVIGYDVPPARACENVWAPTPRASVEDAYRKLEGADGELFKGTYNPADELTKVSEELLTDMVRICGWRDYRFATFTVPWKRVPLDGAPDRLVWRIDPHDIVLANIKPNSTKLELGKKSPVAEFTIERFNGSFEFDDELGDYVVCPAPSQFHSKSPISFTLEPSKGTIELGQTKALRVVSNDPVREFWAGFLKTWERIHVSGGNDALGRDRARMAATNAASESESQRVQMLRQLAAAPQCTSDPTLIVSGPENDDMDELRREAESLEPGEPYYVESVFKITMRGGCRLVDPKGVLFPSEARTWLVKIKADGCESE